MNTHSQTTATNTRTTILTTLNTNTIQRSTWGCRTPTSFASTRRRPALPWLDTTPIGTKGLSSGTIHKAIITTRCHAPGHTGYIAFRATWDTGAEVDFVYKCPEED